MLLYVPGPEIVDAVGVLHAAVFRISFHACGTERMKECLFLHHVHAYTCMHVYHGDYYVLQVL